ncbi:MAG: flagellar basal body-associated FliL family protein [Lacunisphaera sp.]
MAAKPDPKEKEASAAPEKSGSTAAEVPASPRKTPVLKAWLPAIVAILLAPAGSFAVAQFVLLPKLQAKLAAPPAEAEAAHAAAPAEKSGGHGEKKKGHGGKEEGGSSEDTYEFSNVVVNLSGTMGTRYLKTSFVVTGAKPDTIKGAFNDNKARLTDVTLGVLSSLSLSDLEEPGAKNVLREKLVSAYNQALGSRIAEQVYFSDFVVQ